jgi:hypothetical protein
MAGLDTVEVCIDLERFGHPVLMGPLHRQQSGSGEILSFEYDRDWLEQQEVFLLRSGPCPGSRPSVPRTATQELWDILRLRPGPLGKGADAATRKRARAQRKTQTTSPDGVGHSARRSRRNRVGRIAFALSILGSRRWQLVKLSRRFARKPLNPD